MGVPIHVVDAFTQAPFTGNPAAANTSLTTKRLFRAEMQVEIGRYAFVSRFSGPAVGVDEDPVTGSAHCTPVWSVIAST